MGCSTLYILYSLLFLPGVTTILPNGLASLTFSSKISNFDLAVPGFLPAFSASLTFCLNFSTKLLVAVEALITVLLMVLSLRTNSIMTNFFGIPNPRKSF